MSTLPQVGDQLRITNDSDPALCTPGEVVTIVKMEFVHGNVYVYVDGRRDIRRFLWSKA